VYQHRIANVAEAMITDILLAAQEGDFTLRDSSGDMKFLHEAAQEPDAFSRLTDSVLDAIWMSTLPGLEKAEALLQRLKSRKFYRPIAKAVTISTLPACAHCGFDTALKDRFCANCGESTASRKRHTKAGAMPGTTPAVAKGVLLTAARAKRQILEEVNPPLGVDWSDDDCAAWHGRIEAALYVHIVDIQHGKRTDTTDPHGHRWEVYDPLARVGFYNPKERLAEGGGDAYDVIFPTRDRLPELYVPSMCFQRTLYCYLKDDGLDDATWLALEQAIHKWHSNQKLREQLGTSNVATPSSQTPRQSSQLASRASAGANAALGHARQALLEQRLQCEPAGGASRMLSAIDEGGAL